MMLDDRAPPAEPSQIIADLRRERDEALARETAIAEVLQVINSSSGDLAPVFQAITEKAVRLCEATRGTLRTYDGESLSSGRSSAGRSLGTAGRRPGTEQSFPAVRSGEQIVHLADVLSSPEYQSNPPCDRGWMPHVRAVGLAFHCEKMKGYSG